MPTLGNALDFAKYEARNIRGHQLGTAPSSPVTGQMYYNTADNTLYWWDGSVWVSARGGTAATPPATTTSLGTVQLAGDLSGTATVPTIAPNAVTSAKIANGTIVDADVAVANIDGANAVPSMRTLSIDGASATVGQALAGVITLDKVRGPAASVSMASQKIVSMLDPTNPMDAATKQYVDNTSQGLDAKLSVKAASTANLTLSGTQTVDGVALVANDRILVKDQTTQSANGIYVVAAGAWTRTTDADTWNELVSAYVFVEQGTVQADSGWVCTVDQGGTLGTTNVTWSQFSGAGQITAGAGLTKTGNVLDVGGTTNRILVNADNVDIASNYVGQASITTLGTVTTGVWNGSAVPVANGGTGQTTAKAARETGLSAPGYYNNAATHGAGTTITITQATHGLRATRALIVQVQDNATGNVELPDISVAASGDVTITYGASVTANSKLVTIVG